VHGAEVHIIHETGDAAVDDDHRTRSVLEGDGMVSASPSAGLAILTADCASIALGSEEGVFAAVHAGWRGLLGGVIEVATVAMRDLGATVVHGALGPTIHAECYEFSEDDLASVAARYGDGIRSVTSGGRPALDVPAAVAAAFDGANVCPVPGIDACTSCSDRYFSHRGRRDDGRQALVVWSMAESPRP
jgi:copper oxidase (laccase) domain-containing protein